jgi:hypothetical protein
MAFNDKEWKQIQLQESMLFKLKESRRWLNGVAAQINGQFVGQTTIVADKLDDMINGMENMLAKAANDRDG